MKTWLNLIFCFWQRQSDEFRLYVYKQLDIQELLELDGVRFNIWLTFKIFVCRGHLLQKAHCECLTLLSATLDTRRSCALRLRPDADACSSEGPTNERVNGKTRLKLETAHLTTASLSGGGCAACPRASTFGKASP